MTRPVALVARALTLGAAALAAGLVPTAAPVAAQEAGDVVLVDQDFAVTAGRAWAARVELPDATSAAVTATVAVRAVVDTRGELDAALAGETSRVVDVVTIELADAATAADGAAVVDLAVPTSPDPGPDALTLGRPGIYPVSIEIRLADGTIRSHETMLRRLPDDATDDPVFGIAVVAALSDPGPDPGGVALALGRRELEDLAAYGDATTAPLSLALPPSLDLILDGDELLRAAVADALGETELLSLPHLTLDPSSAVAVDQVTRFAGEVRLGEDTLARLFPDAGNRRNAWLVRSPLSGAAASALRDPLGYRLLVLDQATYTALPGTIGSYLDTQLLTSAATGVDGQDLPVAVVDPASQLLADGGDHPTDTAVELLARLLVARTELGADDRRTAVLALDDFVLPDPAVVDALAGLVTGQPDVTMTTLSSVAGRTDTMRLEDTVTQVELPATAGPSLAERLRRIALVRVNTEGAASMLTTNERYQAWRAELDDLVSTGLTDDEVDTVLTRITAEVDAILGSVEAPPPAEFTLTGRESELRLTLTNHAGQPRRVLVRPSSAKLRFPQGDQLVTLQPGRQEIVIPVEARSNGTSSVEIQLLTPVFERQIGPPAILEARVNAIAGLGQMITGVAILLLVSWWYSHFRRRRRQRLADETPPGGLVLGESISPDAAEAQDVRPTATRTADRASASEPGG